MNIKQIIVLLLVSFGASFSAQSSIVKITSLDPIYSIGGCALSSGMTIESSILKNYCTGKPLYQSNVFKGPVFDIGFGSYQLSARYRSSNKVYTKIIGAMTFVSSCPPGQEMVNGVCEEPVICEGDGIFNPDTGLCENPLPFCQQQSTTDAILAADIACDAEGGLFSYECFNETVFSPGSLETTCANPSGCIMGNPAWPECLGDIDPTDPFDPPDTGFDPITPEITDPKPPSFEKPEPDDVIPEDTTDKAVLDAIQNMNRDHNAAATALNTDLNAGFSDVNNELKSLNATNLGIGKSVVDQMNQDYLIHLDSKDLALQQTNAIMAGTSGVTGAIDSQTSSMSSGFNAILTKMDESKPCDPNTDPRSCEGPTGMTSDLVKSLDAQINTSVNSRLDVSEGGIIDAIQTQIDDSQLGPIENIMNDAVDVALGALPKVGDCTPFTMPSPFGGDVSFGCDFSEKFKVIASFLLYIYTLWSLIDILINGVTPVSGTVPYLNRR